MAAPSRKTTARKLAAHAGLAAAGDSNIKSEQDVKGANIADSRRTPMDCKLAERRLCEDFAHLLVEITA